MSEKRKAKKDSDKQRKHERKVALPTDRTGAPIHIGDVLGWDDGTRMWVRSLTYYGPIANAPDDFAWTAEGECEDQFSDNLGASLIVWRGREGRS